MRAAFTYLALAGLLLLSWPVPPARAQALPPDALSQVPGLPHWHWQNPLPTGYHLNDVYPFSDSAALVVGDHGTMLYTADAGRSWQRREAGTTNDLRAVSFAPGSLTGWVIYNTPKINPVREWFTGPGEVRKTTDGGLTWVRQPTNSGEPYSARLYAVQAVSTTECYILYDYSPYYASGPLPGPDSNPLYYVKHTTDGGLTWTRLPVLLPLGRRPTRLAFTSAGTGLVAGGENPGVCLRTTDHGQTWQDVRPPRTQRVTALSFSDAAHGWLAADTGLLAQPAIFRTADGGATWAPVAALPASAGISILELVALDSLTCVAYAVDGNGPVFRTADGGQTWQISLQYSLYGTNFAKLRARLGGATWFLEGSHPRYSADGGQTWQRRFRSIAFDSINRYYGSISRLHFPAPTHGRALSDLRDALLCVDGGPGAAWRRESLRGVAGISWTMGAAVLYGDFPDQDTTHLLISEIGPLDYFYSTVQLTGHGAAQQAVVTRLPLTSAQLGFMPLQLRFRDGRHGVLAGRRGLLLVTQDGGQSWQQPPLPVAIVVHTLSWADDTTVYAAGDSACFLRSTDAGQSWTAVRADSISSYFPNGQPFTSFIRADNSFSDLHFTSAATGYWVPGAPIRTNDGGRHWRSDLFLATLYPLVNNPFGRDPRLRGVRAGYNPRHLWTFGGDQLRSLDGGRNWTIAALTRLENNTFPPAAAACAAIDAYNVVVSRGDGILRYSEKFIQTDTAATQRRAFCTGDTATIAFDTTGVFSPAERSFRVELSNRMGRFRPNQTTILPLLGASSASPLRAVLPAGLAAGTRYRLRVIRADSSVLGGDNARDLTISPRPAAVAVAPTDSARFCAGDSVLLTAPAGFAAYAWSGGATTAAIWVRAAGTYAVRVAQGGGCFGPASRPVTVRVTPRPAAPTLTPTQPGSGPVLLTAAPALPGATYVWTGPGGVVAGATGPTLLLTAAAQNGPYSVTVTARGCASPASNSVNVAITGLEQETSRAVLTLSPNPTATAVTLRSAPGLREVAVRDQVGRVVLRWPGGGATEVTVPVAALPAGSYLVCATLITGQQLTRRLLVQH